MPMPHCREVASNPLLRLVATATWQAETSSRGTRDTTVPRFATTSTQSFPFLNLVNRTRPTPQVLTKDCETLPPMF